MNEKSIKQRATYIMLLMVAMVIVTLSSCEDVDDMAVKKVASPVLLDVKNSAANEITAHFYELDKSDILDHTVGIDSIPVSGLSIEVFAGTASVGVFTTGGDGSFSVSYEGAKPSEYAGVHKGIAFRIKK